MAEVRVIGELTAKDAKAATNFVQRVSTFVEANLPDTVAWEAFTDEATGRWMWYEVFKDEQALAAYEKAVNQEGMRETQRNYSNSSPYVTRRPQTQADV